MDNILTYKLNNKELNFEVIPSNYLNQFNNNKKYSKIKHYFNKCKGLNNLSLEESLELLDRINIKTDSKINNKKISDVYRFLTDYFSSDYNYNDYNDVNYGNSNNNVKKHDINLEKKHNQMKNNYNKETLALFLIMNIVKLSKKSKDLDFIKNYTDSDDFYLYSLFDANNFNFKLIKEKDLNFILNYTSNLVVAQKCIDNIYEYELVFKDIKKEVADLILNDQVNRINKVKLDTIDNNNFTVVDDFFNLLNLKINLNSSDYNNKIYDFLIKLNEGYSSGSVSRKDCRFLELLTKILEEVNKKDSIFNEVEKKEFLNFLVSSNMKASEVIVINVLNNKNENFNIFKYLNDENKDIITKCLIQEKKIILIEKLISQNVNINQDVILKEYINSLEEKTPNLHQLLSSRLEKLKIIEQVNKGLLENNSKVNNKRKM